MKYEDEREIRLEGIRFKKVIELSNWWGHDYHGEAGIIITSDKEVYKYRYFHNRIPDDIPKKKANFIVKEKELTDKEYKKLIEFLEKDLLLKETGMYIMRDAGYKIEAKYEKYGIDKVSYNDIDLYEYTEKFIKELIK